MLDLLISYVNLLILSIRFFVKKILFQPPNPKGYKIIENSNNSKNPIEIYIRKRNFKNYHTIKKKVQIDIEFKKIRNNIPIFIFKPTLFLHRSCIIYCHGNSCDIGSTFNECCDLAKLTKCMVINFDYPGYGMNDNAEPDEENIYKTVRIIYEYVKEELNFDENSIIVYGFSLGTGVAFDLACNKNYKFAGLILQSPFLSIIRTMFNTKKTKYFDLFNNCDKAKYLNIKTLFIHGNQDKIVPYVHGRILSKLIPKNKLYDFQTINGAGHNDILTPKNLPSISGTIKEFIESCCAFQSKYKDNKTVRNKDIRSFDRSIIDPKKNNINKIHFNFNNINQNINSSYTKFIGGNYISNTSINESRKYDINDKEIENKSFSENNSAFLSRKKESFLEILRTTKNDESHYIKSFYEDKNGFDSEDKFTKSEKKNKKITIGNSRDVNSSNIIDKSQKNFLIKGEKNSNYDNIKTLNMSESSETQKEDFSNNEYEFNIFKKKTNKKSLQKAINISKSDY